MTDCHAAAWRMTHRPPVWTELVPSPADGPLAARRRGAELSRGLADGLFRAVLLRYQDGVADLIIVADRGLDLAAVARHVVSGADLPGPIAGELTTTPERPEWATGDAPAGRVSFPPLDAGPEVLKRALDLVHDRYGGPAVATLLLKPPPEADDVGPLVGYEPRPTSPLAIDARRGQPFTGKAGSTRRSCSSSSGTSPRPSRPWWTIPVRKRFSTRPSSGGSPGSAASAIR